MGGVVEGTNNRGGWQRFWGRAAHPPARTYPYFSEQTRICFEQTRISSGQTRISSGQTRIYTLALPAGPAINLLLRIFDHLLARTLRAFDGMRPPPPRFGPAPTR